MAIAQQTGERLNVIALEELQAYVGATAGQEVLVMRLDETTIAGTNRFGKVSYEEGADRWGFVLSLKSGATKVFADEVVALDTVDGADLCS